MLRRRKDVFVVISNLCFDASSNLQSGVMINLNYELCKLIFGQGVRVSVEDTSDNQSIKVNKTMEKRGNW